VSRRRASDGYAPVTIAIVDYGMGNLRSAEKAFEHVGATAEVTRDHHRIRAAAGIVLPGVGAFPKAVAEIRRLGFEDLLAERLAAGTPVLGICLGMQLLFEASTELGGAEGLGLLEGRVEPLDAGAVKVPHIGWNHVAWRRESPLAAGLPSRCAFYHVHSFAPAPGRLEDVLGTVLYGGELVSAVERPPLYGVQFHPEKSGPDGLRLLANFATICEPAVSPALSPSRRGARGVLPPRA
jgi:imidazole glycerol-phosphate synthase subunit HisH